MPAVLAYPAEQPSDPSVVEDNQACSRPNLVECKTTEECPDPETSTTIKQEEKKRPANSESMSSGLMDNSISMAKSFVHNSNCGMNLDEYERYIEKKKLAKKNECMQLKRKVGYDKNVKNEIVDKMKVSTTKYVMNLKHDRCQRGLC